MTVQGKLTATVTNDAMPRPLLGALGGGAYPVYGGGTGG